MPATISGAVKSVVEGLGLGLACYRDGAPSRDGLPAPTLPYVTVQERIAASLDADGTFDAGVNHTLRETVQVNLWQQWRNPQTGAPAESYTLARALLQGLRAASLTGLPFRVYGSRAEATARLLESEENVVHDVLTLTVYREV